MSQKQWGHGYHNGIKSATENSKSLVGIYAHILKDGKPNNQGVFIKDLPGDRYLFQFFSYMDGRPTCSKIFKIDQLDDFVFYTSDYEMRYADYCSKETHESSFEELEERREWLQKILDGK